MKKMIPRLVVAAILVNASFYIAAAAVDVSNLLGYNIINLFEALEVSDVGTNSKGLYTEIIGSVLAFGAGVGLLALIVTAPATLLAFAVIALILVARKALIVLLIVVAPIAFVAYLLPNTESWFKKWYKMFITLLMVFPVIAAVFGASTLASEVLMSIANAGDVEADGPDQVLYIIALGVAAIPLFAVPALLKGSLAAAGNIGAKISGYADRSQGYANKKIKSRGDRLGNRAKSFATDKGSAISNSSRFGRALGGRNSFRRRKLAAIASLGATSAADSEQRDKYAKVAAEASARNYVAKTASNSPGYARSLAGGKFTPGSKDMGRLVESYAVQATREEEKKDIEAARAQILDKNPDSDRFVDKLKDENYDKAQAGAYAAEIAKRGSGADFQKAIVESRKIKDKERRRIVQSQLISNMREDHFGVSDRMRGAMMTGDVDESFNVTDEKGNIRKNALGGDFSSLYSASLDQRLEEKLTAEKVVSMKKHDMSATRGLISQNHITDDALRKMITRMAEAERNDNTRKEIKGETETLFKEARALAAKRGIAAEATPTT